MIYVDDILCTCHDPAKVEWVYEKLVEKFKDVTIHRGDKISYLGQSFDFSVPGKVKVTMEGYVADVLNQFKVDGYAATPALENLFDVSYLSEPLSADDRDEFHSSVAKLLYLALRVRPDILLPVNFLGTRVSCATKGDVVKLERVLKYLNSTQDLGLTIDVNRNIQVIAYVDASYAVHKDFKSHTGATITLGAGPVWVKSVKQRLVSKSSTESEVIGVSDALSQIIWTRDFLIEQGYDVGPAVLKQDNQSSILMMERGEATSNRSRHIGIRYFFVKDRIDGGEIVAEWLPTGDMVADIFTKPLQGEQFRFLQGKLMNL
jgi:hypothetical protein